MKKKILSLLAAFFMLFGTSAMAQVDSTLEGDVNGDGVVDIADITAVIAIIKQNAEANPTYYWYVGQENPASIDDITKLKGIQQVTSYPETYDYTVEKRGYIYILLSNSKTLSRIIDTSNGFDINYSETTSPVSGYKLYKTPGVAAGCPLRFTIS